MDYPPPGNDQSNRPPQDVAPEFPRSPKMIKFATMAPHSFGRPMDPRQCLPKEAGFPPRQTSNVHSTISLPSIREMVPQINDPAPPILTDRSAPARSVRTRPDGSLVDGAASLTGLPPPPVRVVQEVPWPIRSDVARGSPAGSASQRPPQQPEYVHSPGTSVVDSPESLKRRRGLLDDDVYAMKHGRDRQVPRRCLGLADEAAAAAAAAAADNGWEAEGRDRDLPNRSRPLPYRPPEVDTRNLVQSTTSSPFSDAPPGAFYDSVTGRRYTTTATSGPRHHDGFHAEGGASHHQSSSPARMTGSSVLVGSEPTPEYRNAREYYGPRLRDPEHPTFPPPRLQGHERRLSSFSRKPSASVPPPGPSSSPHSMLSSRPDSLSEHPKPWAPSRSQQHPRPSVDDFCPRPHELEHAQRQYDARFDHRYDRYDGRQHQPDDGRRAHYATSPHEYQHHRRLYDHVHEYGGFEDDGIVAVAGDGGVGGDPFGHGASFGIDARSRKRRGNLPKETTDKMRAWFVSHLAHPYPTEEEKQELMQQTGLHMNQISNWFINARRRHLPGMVKEKNESTGPARKPDMTSMTSETFNGPTMLATKSRNSPDTAAAAATSASAGGHVSSVQGSISADGTAQALPSADDRSSRNSSTGVGSIANLLTADRSPSLKSLRHA